MQREQQDPSRRRVAVVGSGVAGLTAAWALHTAADVVLYEADDRLGGHADTHDVTDSAGRLLAVDTGSSCTTGAPTPPCCGCSGSSGSRLRSRT